MKLQVKDFPIPGSDLVLSLEPGKVILLKDETYVKAEALLEALCGINDSFEQLIVIDETPISDFPAGGSDVFAYVFDEGIMISNLTLVENLYLPFQLRFGNDKRESFEQELENWMQVFELKTDLSLRPAFVKAAQKKLLCYIRALLLKPRVLLFDNPLYLLSSNERRRLLSILEDLKRDFAMLICSNDDEFASGFCSSIITIPA